MTASSRILLIILVLSILQSSSQDQDDPSCKDVAVHRRTQCPPRWHLLVLGLLESNADAFAHQKFVRELLQPCVLAERGKKESKVTFVGGNKFTPTFNFSDPKLLEPQDFLFVIPKENQTLSDNVFDTITRLANTNVTPGYPPDEFTTIMYIITNIDCEVLMTSYWDVFNAIYKSQFWKTAVSRFIWTTTQVNVSDCYMEFMVSDSKGMFNYDSNNFLNYDLNMVIRYGMCDINTTEIGNPFASPSPTEHPQPGKKWAKIAAYVGGFGCLLLILTVGATCLLKRFLCPGWRPFSEDSPDMDKDVTFITAVTNRWKNNQKKKNSYMRTSQMGRMYRSDTASEDEWQIQAGSLQIMSDRQLGSGAYAEVFRGKLSGTPPVIKVFPTMQLSYLLSVNENDVAVKTCFSHASSEEKRDLIQEIEFMKKLEYYPHLLSMLGCSTDPNYPLIITELCDRGDLVQALKEMQTARGKEGVEDVLEFRDLLPIAWQISDSLAYLTAKNIIHRDVAARNVLLTKKKMAKLSDFGLCRFSDQKFYTTRGGKLPLKWMAPESIEYARFSTKSDVWSYGVLLFEMYTYGQTPYHYVQPENFLSHLKEGSRMEIPEEAPEVIAKLMAECWKFEPEIRPEFRNIRQGLYMTMETDSEGYGYLQISNHYYKHILQLHDPDKKLETQTSLEPIPEADYCSINDDIYVCACVFLRNTVTGFEIIRIFEAD